MLQIEDDYNPQKLPLAVISESSKRVTLKVEKKTLFNSSEIAFIVVKRKTEFLNCGF